jgi:hypothetical protein
MMAVGAAGQPAGCTFRAKAADTAAVVGVLALVEAVGVVAAPDAPRLVPIRRNHSPAAVGQAAQIAGHNADTLRQVLGAAGHSADKLSRYSSFQYGSGCQTESYQVWPVPVISDLSKYRQQQ